MSGQDRPEPTPFVPPWASKLGDRPNPLWPAAVRRFWLAAWMDGYWDGYERAQYERRELDAQERAA